VVELVTIGLILVVIVLLGGLGVRSGDADFRAWLGVTRDIHYFTIFNYMII
jgi:hypothetical protein